MIRKLTLSLFLSTCCLLTSLSLHAETPEIQALHEQLDQNLGIVFENYIDALLAAAKTQDLKDIESYVEMDSPWYKMLVLSKEHRHLKAPYAAGGFPYYPIPFLIAMTLMGSFDQYKDEFTVKDLGENLFKISMGEVSMVVRIQDGHLKFYSFCIPNLQSLYCMQLT